MLQKWKLALVKPVIVKTSNEIVIKESYRIILLIWIK